MPSMTTGMGTFSHKRVDAEALHDRLCQDAEARNGVRRVLQSVVADIAAWKISRRNVRRVLEMTSGSTPGPDGFPYLA